MESEGFILTKPVGYDAELALHQTIAGLLDKPSVYMGGPSKQNMRRAEEIVTALRRDTDLLAQLIGHPVEPTEKHEPWCDQGCDCGGRPRLIRQAEPKCKHLNVRGSVDMSGHSESSCLDCGANLKGFIPAPGNWQVRLAESMPAPVFVESCQHPADGICPTCHQRLMAEAQSPLTLWDLADKTVDVLLERGFVSMQAAHRGMRLRIDKWPANEAVGQAAWESEGGNAENRNPEVKPGCDHDPWSLDCTIAGWVTFKAERYRQCSVCLHRVPPASPENRT